MYIGIIEVCEPNHYTAVEALAKTYAIQPANQVVVFTLPQIAPLLDKKGKQIIVKQEGQSINDFLAHIATFKLDRLHINTVSKFYKEFAQAQWHCQVYLTVHNIDQFFDNSILHRTRKLFYEWKLWLTGRSKITFSTPLAQYVKDFKRQAYRDNMVKTLISKNARFIVYGHAQKKYLSTMLNADKIIVFPFCINEGMPDTSAQNTRLRICIPGSVSTKRRDYDSLFALIKNNPDIRQNITLDILGYIPEADRYLITIMDQLIKQGAHILYSLNFIDINDFDSRLSQCDIILGNLKIQLDLFQKYGITKESGIIFNIIKAGKPGLIPVGYAVDNELKDVCCYFEDYAGLANHIRSFINDSGKLNDLKTLASQKVKYYQPQNLYKILVS